MLSRPLLFACLLVALAACDNGSEAKFIASAKALMAKRDTNAAIIQLKNALDKNPNSAAARLMLGQVLLQSGDPKAALVQLAKAKEAKAADAQVVPEIARALLLEDEGKTLIAQYGELTLSDAAAMADLKTSLASAYAAQGDIERSRAAASAALLAQPGYAPAIVVRARLDAGQGDAAGALRALDGVLANAPDDAAAGLLKGEILLFARDDADAAMEAMRKVLAANPDSVAARTAVINTLIQQKQRAEARSELERLRKVAPNHPETQFLRAQFAFDDQDYPTSRDITERLLAAMPNNLRVLMLACALEYRLQHFTLAEGLMSRAKKRAGDHLIPQHMLVQHYLRAELPDKAIEVLSPLVELRRPDAASLALIGQAYQQAGDDKRAEAAFRRTLQIVPGDERTRTALALLQIGRGESGPAMAELEAIAKDGISTQADLALINERMRIEDLQGALRAIDGLEKKLPGQTQPQLLRGRVLAQQGDLPAAIAAFEKASNLERNNFAAIAALASIDFDAGQPDRARQRFETLLKADPKDFRAKVALAEIDARLGAPDTVVTAQLQAATRLDPTQPAPYLRLIEQLLASGNSKAGLAAADAARTALPNDLGILEALGQAQLASGDSLRAAATFKALAALQPASSLPQVRLAAALLAAKDMAGAERALRQAIGIRPDDLMAERSLALLAQIDKRPEEGLAIARGVQQRLPRNPFGFALEGELEANRQRWPAAAAAYRAALQRSASSELAVKLHRSLLAAGQSPEAERMASGWRNDHPKDADFVYHLGDTASAARDWPRAEGLYREVLVLKPLHAAALNNVAWLMANQGKPGAAAMAEQAIALRPGNASLLDTLALAQASEGRLAQAIQTQKRATAVDSKNPQLRLHLAQLLVKQGEKSEAREQLELLAKLGRNFTGHAEVTAMLGGL